MHAHVHGGTQKCTDRESGTEAEREAGRQGGSTKNGNLSSNEIWLKIHCGLWCRVPAEREEALGLDFNGFVAWGNAKWILHQVGCFCLELIVFWLSLFFQVYGGDGRALEFL